MENIVREGELACNKQFLLFSQFFLSDMHFKMLSAICINYDQSKILLSGNGLKVAPTVKYRFLAHLSTKCS